MPELNAFLAHLKRVFPEAMHPNLWLVGGTVRDLFSGMAPKDIDLVCNLPSERLKEIMFREVRGKSTSPVMFKATPGYLKTEITVLDEGVRIDEELNRRDFRCNAVAIGLENIISDPLDGVSDILSGTLTPCSDRSLVNDPLRIFRAFRFVAHGWRISEELSTLIRLQSWDDALGQIPVERFSREMQKAMKGDYQIGRAHV